MLYSTLNDVRDDLDRIDNELVAIIAKRAKCVKAAAQFKTSHCAVQAPERVQQIIDNACKKAHDVDIPEEIIEAIYRAMITAFIHYETEQFDQLK